ncbi:MAG: TenA family protein [Pseudomonadota bacterium]
MLNHRFVIDVASDSLRHPVFERYLHFEGGFVETAIEIVSLAVAKAPTLSDKRHLIGVLDSLANTQMDYFERTLSALASKGDGARAASAASPKVPHDVAAFVDGMRTLAAEGTYLDIIASMFAAEWMYATWCKRAAESPISDPVLKEWVALHTTDDFLSGAKWLKDELDRHGESPDTTTRRRLSAIFALVMRLEIDFHSAAYAG